VDRNVFSCSYSRCSQNKLQYELRVCEKRTGFRMWEIIRCECTRLWFITSHCTLNAPCIGLVYFKNAAIWCLLNRNREQHFMSTKYSSELNISTKCFIWYFAYLNGLGVELLRIRIVVTKLIRLQISHYTVTNNFPSLQLT